MKRLMYLIAAVGCIGLMLSRIPALAAEHPGSAAEKKEAVTQSVFVCPDCHTMALKTGKCAKCEKDLKELHVLGVKDGNALLCSCGAGCKCDASKLKDEKCGCGKDVVKMSAKGMYVCADGCPEISAKPGKCACGKKMEKIK
jgi:hypothetical protein